MPTQPDSRFVVPTFLPTDDPIASLNKSMIFLSLAYSSRYPPTNNQLRTSSNPRTQAIIQNGLVMARNVQGIQSQGYTGNVGKSQATGARVVNTVRDAGENQPRNDDYDDLHLHTIANFKADHVDAYDSDCDDQATASVIFMASLSPIGSLNDNIIGPTYDSSTLSNVPHYDTYHDSDILNLDDQETEYIEHIVSNKDSYDEPTSDNKVISYADYMDIIENNDAQNVPSSVQNDDMMLSAIEQIKFQVEQLYNGKSRG
ncbi:hypothetical protein Tco_0175256 [Tanacetum coccineum]